MSVVVVLPVKRFEIAKQRLGDGGLRRPTASRWRPGC